MENSMALKDPVCGMAVTNKSFHQSDHMGQRFYFCGAKCKARFAANALRYSDEPTGSAGTPVLAAPLPAFKLNRGWMMVAALVLAVLLGLATLGMLQGGS
jgi:YHS domain-containing protein